MKLKAKLLEAMLIALFLAGASFCPACATITKLYITPDSVGILEGMSQRFCVFGLNEDGETVALPDGAVWHAQESTGVIDAGGVFTAGFVPTWHSAGVWVSYEGLTAQASIQVLGGGVQGGYRLERYWGTSDAASSLGGGPANGYLSNPCGIAADASGNVYVVDSGNSRVQVFDSSGSFISAWDPRQGYFFSVPYGIAVSPVGHVYVTDESGVMAFTPDGTPLDWWPIGRFSGFSNTPIHWGIGVGTGAVFIADFQNSLIRRLDSAGQLEGTWGQYGGAAGDFVYPAGLAVAPDASVYVADAGNHRVQRFTSSGSLLATFGVSGSAPGEFNTPEGVTVDWLGRVYVVESGNARVQVFTSDGLYLSQFGSAGTGPGQFAYPEAVAVGSNGEVYVADSSNARVQKFVYAGTQSVPSTPVVTDNGAFATSGAQVQIAWSASDAVSGIAEYRYAVGTSAVYPGDGNVPGWVSAGLSAGVTGSALSLQPGRCYYFYVKARNGAGLWSNAGVSDGIMVVSATPVSAGEAKGLPDGTAAGLSGMVVTAPAASLSGRMYVETPDRSSGIAVETSVAYVEGDVLDVAGTLATAGNGERTITAPLFQQVGRDQAIRPPVLPMKSVGSRAFLGAGTGEGQRGITGPDGCNLSTIGLLIRVSGLVTDLDSSYVYVNDGSWPAYATGLRVERTYAPPDLQVGDYIGVTGISSLRWTGASYQMLLRPRYITDFTRP